MTVSTYICTTVRTTDMCTGYFILQGKIKHLGSVDKKVQTIFNYIDRSV